MPITCLMGKFGNGELAGGRVADPAGTSNDCGRLFSRFAPHNVAVPEIDVSSDDCDPAARGRRQGDTMLETYFAAPQALERLRAGPSGPYMDGFAASLTIYRPFSGICGPAAVHGGREAQPPH